MKSTIRWGLLLGALSFACGGDGTTTSPTSPTTTTPVDTTTITISSGGAVTPKSIRVASGSRVTMINNDSRAHDMNSDPHPAHTECPAINWGTIQPGQSAQSDVLTTVRTCGYHDHNLPTHTSLQGAIQIQ
jgi:plastocyanin